MSDFESEADSDAASSDSDGFETLHVRVGGRADYATEAVGLRDHAENFETLDRDVLREEGSDAGSGDSDDDAFSGWGEDKKKKKKTKSGDNEAEDDKDDSELVEFYDFRRGPKHWPRGVELISEERGRELIDAALDEANKKQDKEKQKSGTTSGATGATSGKAGKYGAGDDEDDVFGSSTAKKGEGEKDEDEKDGEKKALGPGLPPPGFYDAQSSEDEIPLDPEDDLIDPAAVVRARENQAPPEAKFEYQRDRSAALLLTPGTRLKLDISGLTHEGRDKKKKAERTRMREALMSASAKEKAEKKAKDKKKRQSAYSWYEYEGGAWDKDAWGMKTYVNDYTITFDVKLKREPPREGLSLFQTSLVYTEENPSSGRKTIKQSDGECVIGANGGVGVFGQYGDVVRAKVELDRWRRVVISVKNVSEGKGEMRTWVDTVPCAVIRRDAFSTDGRFALDAETLYLFSSQKGSMMPGDILLRCIKVEVGASTDDTVKSRHAENKVISMHEEERAQKAEEQRRGLSLAKLFPKPRPLWTAPTLVGAVGDPFIEKTVYEGSSVISWSYKVMHFAMRRCVEEQSEFLHGLSLEQRGAISDVLHVMHQSSPLMQQMLKLLLHPNDSQVLSYIGKLRKFLGAMGVGDSLMLPAVVEGWELMIIVSRSAEQMFRFVIVETDPERGLGNHAVNPSLGTKLKYRTCLVLNNIPKKNALDNVFWMAVYALSVHTQDGDLTRFYDVLLPFLTGKPLETSLWEAEEATLNSEENDAGVIGEWCSPQRSSTAYVRCFLHALRHMLRTRGLGHLETKQVLLALRAQLIAMLDNDLQFVHPDDNGQRVCRMACSQLSYAAVKLANVLEVAKVPHAKEFATKALEKTKAMVDSVLEKLAACEDGEVELPPDLDLRDKIPEEEKEGHEQKVAEDKQKKRLQEEAEMEKEDRSGSAIELTVRFGPSGSTKIKLFTTSKILHLQTRIAMQLGIGMDEQRLIFMGKLLKPESTLKECGLAEESGLTVQLSQTQAGAQAQAEEGEADKRQEELNAEQRMRKVRAALRRDPDAPAMTTQFMDGLAWDAEQVHPNPGLAVSLRKYVPIDVLQMPSRVETREDAVRAIRLCDRLCTLMDNQPHCIKNDRFLIAALIQHTFTQLVPIPKPRPVDANQRDTLGRNVVELTGRAERRKQRKAQRRERRKETSKQAAADKVEKGEGTEGNADKKEPVVAPVTSRSASGVTPKDEGLPDFSRGSAYEAEITAQKCLWDQSITYELQVEVMIELQRITEHFVASLFSIQQDRPFDSVAIVTLGCISAIADAIMRRRASDLPSEVCSHLMGQTRDGRQLGVAGYGISPSSFATQTETIEAHTPELCIARTAVLDYFQSPQQRRLEKIFNWERHYELKPERTLIKYMRAVQREIAHSDSMPHTLLVDGTPVENSMLKKNYPELRCYRDIVFYWKCLMNPDIKAFPNYIDMRKDGAIGSFARFGRMAAQLHWNFEHNQNTSGYAVYCQFQSVMLRCRPEPDRDAKGETFSKERQPPTHRFPSTATPSFYVTDLPVIRTEDDVIYRPNLPGFEDDHESKRRIKALMPKEGVSLFNVGGSSSKKKHGAMEKSSGPRQQVLGQHDSELLISYLTVPYLRLPLVITFFASDDRLHKLQSHKLRAILDSVMFEPGRYLSLDLVGVAPTMVPTPHPQLLATPFGLLLNELVRSPNTVLSALDALLEGALALDTGSVCDLGEDDFNVSVDIILYIARLGARCESFVSFLISIAKGEHECYPRDMKFRDLEITADCLEKLEQGRRMLRRRLLKDFDELFEDYLRRLDHETKRDPNNEKLVDRNSRLAADLHAVKLLFHRNTKPEEYDNQTARTLIGSFVFLTTRHTWNKATRQQGKLLVPETELYEILQVQRRRLIQFSRGCQQGALDQIMQSGLQIATSAAGSFRASGEVVDAHNRWARISGDRSVGRFAVGSTRTVGEDENSVMRKHSSGLQSANSSSSTPTAASEGAAGGRNPLVPLARQKSHLSEVGEVADSGVLGVELDLQIGQMTLRSKHLSALPSDVANHPDVHAVFGTATMQASVVERAAHRTIFRLVGLHHDIEGWFTAHTETPPLPDAFERDYDPSELFDSESWIPPLFEPVRKAFFDGINPPPMQFMMLDRPLPEHAEVAVLIGVHQSLGGASKLVYLFRKLRCVHVYQVVSHGRRFWWTLHLTTDVRYCYRELQPSFAPRSAPPPAWWKNGGGEPYPPNRHVPKHLFDDIVSPPGVNSMCERSVLVIRDASHPDNLSNGKETLVPSRFLMGLIPECLLDAYRFWRDESGESSKGRLGHVRMLGYPLDPEDEFVIRVEIQAQKALEICGHLPARTVRLIRKLKVDQVKECEQNRRIAEVLEQTGLLLRDSKTLRKARRAAKKAEKAAAADEDDGLYARRVGDEESEEEEDPEVQFDADNDGDDEDEGENNEVDLVVGAIVEHAIRTNAWVEAVIMAVHDDETVDIELRGDVHSGVYLHRVHPRDIRKKQATDTPARDGEDDDDEGGFPTKQQLNRAGGNSRLARKKGQAPQQQRKNRTEGEGIWHWQGMSDSDDADWASHSSDDEGNKSDDGETDEAKTRSKKAALSFAQIDQVPLLLEACNGDEALLISTLKRLPPPPEAFTNVMRLARVVSRFLTGKQDPSALTSHLRIANDSDFIMLNALYAPKGSRLFSLLRTLARIENMSNVLIWSKVANLPKHQRLHGEIPHSGVPSIDLVELPRLKLSFTARPDHSGVVRLYSLDHADLFVTNDRNPMTSKMLEGIPHSLLLCNTQGETSVLVPVVSVKRPIIYSQPFSTDLVLDRNDAPWSAVLTQRYFIYPVHVSFSFLMSKGIESGLYMLLLRFFHRDYVNVFRLADSIATDTVLSPAGQAIFHSLALANDDFHPDAHACRLKISLVTIDSGVKLPWDLTLQCARYITKLSHVSAACRLSMEEELQLLETEGAIAYEPSSPAYRKKIHTPYVRALVRNRQQALTGMLNNKAQVSCYAPQRPPLSNWPYYVDNTVFGVVYEEMVEIKSVEQWEDLLKTGE